MRDCVGCYSGNVNPYLHDSLSEVQKWTSIMVLFYDFDRILVYNLVERVALLCWDVFLILVIHFSCIDLDEVTYFVL